MAGELRSGPDPAAASGLELFLFSTDATMVREAVAAGVRGIVVDWERQGKKERQAGADTQIGCDTLDDLVRVRGCTAAPIICRINRGPTSREDLEAAVAGGADEILLPMVETIEEVEAALQQVDGRAGLGILVETTRAVRLAPHLGRLPLARVYVGLNDLAIERRSVTIFEALADGTVESLRRHFPVPFGFGGLTLPGRGFPLPCGLLMAEMTRLGCGYTFLRRSFLADTRGRPFDAAVAEIRAGLGLCATRSSDEVMRDHGNLVQAIRNLMVGGRA